MLDDSAFGGYLMWRYPDLDFVSSGYGDLYTTAELDRGVAIAELKPGWDALVRQLGTQWAVLDPETPLAYALTEQEGWRVARRSPDVLLLQAP